MTERKRSLIDIAYSAREITEHAQVAYWSDGNDSYHVARILEMFDALAHDVAKLREARNT